MAKERISLATARELVAKGKKPEDVLANFDVLEDDTAPPARLPQGTSEPYDFNARHRPNAPERLPGDAPLYDTPTTAQQFWGQITDLPATVTENIRTSSLPAIAAGVENMSKDEVKQTTKGWGVVPGVGAIKAMQSKGYREGVQTLAEEADKLHDTPGIDRSSDPIAPMAGKLIGDLPLFMLQPEVGAGLAADVTIAASKRLAGTIAPRVAGYLVKQGLNVPLDVIAGGLAGLAETGQFPTKLSELAKQGGIAFAARLLLGAGALGKEGPKTHTSDAIADFYEKRLAQTDSLTDPAVRARIQEDYQAAMSGAAKGAPKAEPLPGAPRGVGGTASYVTQAVETELTTRGQKYAESIKQELGNAGVPGDQVAQYADAAGVRLAYGEMALDGTKGRTLREAADLRENITMQLTDAGRPAKEAEHLGNVWSERYLSWKDETGGTYKQFLEQQGPIFRQGTGADLPDAGLAQLTPEYSAKLKAMIEEGDPDAAHYQAALDIQARLDKNPMYWKLNPEKPWLEGNGDYYKLSTDPDLLCQRSEGTDVAVHYLKSHLGKNYSNDMAWEIIARSNKKGLQTPCPQCYVVSARSMPESFAQQKRYVVGLGGYSGDLWRKADSTHELLRDRGLRHYSSTDFKAEHIPGLIAETVDLAKLKIPLAAYTKQADFAEIFGPSGAYINLSVGRDTITGMDYAEAVRLRNTHKNASTVYIGYNDAEIMAALRDPNIDHVIPWHFSGQSAKELSAKLGVPNTKEHIRDYTMVQSDRIDGRKAPDDLQVRDKDHGGDLETYLRIAKERGLEIRFKEFYDALGPDEKDLYMKLVGREYGKFGDKGAYEAPTTNFNLDHVKVAMKNRLKTALGSHKDYLDVARGIVREVRRGKYERGPVQPLVATGPFSKPARTPRDQAILAESSQALKQEGSLGEIVKGFTVPETRIITLMQNADASTVLHESAHLWRRGLTGDMRQTIEQWVGVRQGQEWSVAAEEKFARAIERYFAEGKAPNASLEGAFAQFKQWLMQVYRKITGSDIDIPIPDEVRQVFDQMFGANREGGIRAKIEVVKTPAGIVPKAESGGTPLFQAGPLRRFQVGDSIGTPDGRRGTVVGRDKDLVRVRLDDGTVRPYRFGELEWTGNQIGNPRDERVLFQTAKDPLEELRQKVEAAHARMIEHRNTVGTDDPQWHQLRRQWEDAQTELSKAERKARGLSPRRDRTVDERAPRRRGPVDDSEPIDEYSEVDDDVRSNGPRRLYQTAKDEDKYARPSSVNLERLDTTEAVKDEIRDAAMLDPRVAERKGAPLTHQEVIDRAKLTEPVTSTPNREATLDRGAAILSMRQRLVALGEEVQRTGKVTPEFLDALEVVSAHAAEEGRLLNMFAIKADASLMGPELRMIKDIIKRGTPKEKVLDAAKNVDFRDFAQASKFYRSFVKPNLSQILNTYRYGNMLSAPLTHIVNAFSNAIQTQLRPVVLFADGSIDYVLSSLRPGLKRRYTMKQVPAYYRGMASGFGEAAQAAKDAFLHRKMPDRPDLARIPSGIKALAPWEKVLDALEAGDAFFRTLVRKGETAQLSEQMKAQTGKPFIDPVELAGIEKQAEENAAYQIFRKPLDPSNDTGQGYLLSVIDHVSAAIQKVRNAPEKLGPAKVVIDLVSSTALPFVETPMNIFKQGVEYSPVGFLNIPGSANKLEQASKALIGSTIFAGAYGLAQEGRLTWSTPRDKKLRDQFTSAGMQPYAIKMGDHWVSLNKLGPLAYPFAMASAFHHYSSVDPKTVAADNNWVTAGHILGGIVEFFGDQSYVEQIGQVWDAVLNRDPSAWSRYANNAAAQWVPFSAMLRWVNNGFVDPVFRKTKSGLTPDALVSNIKKGIPWMSQDVAPHQDIYGMPSARQYPAINAFNPMPITKENPAAKIEYDTTMSTRRINAKMKALNDKYKGDQ